MTRQCPRDVWRTFNLRQHAHHKIYVEKKKTKLLLKLHPWSPRTSAPNCKFDRPSTKWWTNKELRSHSSTCDTRMSLEACRFIVHDGMFRLASRRHTLRKAKNSVYTVLLKNSQILCNVTRYTSSILNECQKKRLIFSGNRFVIRVELLAYPVVIQYVCMHLLESFEIMIIRPDQAWQFSFDRELIIQRWYHWERSITRRFFLLLKTSLSVWNVGLYP